MGWPFKANTKQGGISMAAFDVSAKLKEMLGNGWGHRHHVAEAGNAAGHVP